MPTTKNCTFLQEFFIIISEAEQKQIEYIRSSSLAQKSPNLTCDPLELLKADEVLDPVNGGGLQDLVAGELSHSLGRLLALLCNTYNQLCRYVPTPSPPTPHSTQFLHIYFAI